jgi:hypothetical protein
MKINEQLYKAIDVWKRASGEVLVCYRCFELILASEDEPRFCVQNADHYYSSDAGKNYEFFQRNFLELLFEQAPSKRSRVFKTIDEAIRDFEHDFKDLEPKSEVRNEG